MARFPAHFAVSDGEDRGRDVRPARGVLMKSAEAPLDPESNRHNRHLTHATAAEARRGCLENPAHFRRSFFADAVNSGEGVG